MIQFIAIAVFFAMIAYSRAKASGRSPIKWAAIACFSYLIAFAFISLIVGFLLGYGEDAWGWSPNLINDWRITTVIPLVGGVIITWIVIHPLQKQSDENAERPRA